MMKRFMIIIIWGVFFVLALAKSAYADSGRFAVSGKVSTLGLGGEVTIRLVPNLNVRLGLNAFDFGYSATEAGIEYDIDLQLRSFLGLLDWHLFGGSFRLSGGLLVNQNELGLQATPIDDLLIGDTYFTPIQIGTLRGSVSFDDLAPYVGMGWGNAVGEGRLGVSIDLGVVFQGTPHVDLTTDGILAGDVAFLTELARERQEVAEALDAFRFWPVIALGVFFRF